MKFYKFIKFYEEFLFTPKTLVKYYFYFQNELTIAEKMPNLQKEEREWAEKSKIFPFFLFRAIFLSKIFFQSQN
jgi:hypothetical protein